MCQVVIISKHIELGSCAKDEEVTKIRRKLSYIVSDQEKQNMYD